MQSLKDIASIITEIYLIENHMYMLSSCYNSIVSFFSLMKFVIENLKGIFSIITDIASIII